MFRLPVLAGAAGALGAQYCSPYLAVDGAYGRQPGQTSAMDTSRLVQFFSINISFVAISFSLLQYLITRFLI